LVGVKVYYADHYVVSFQVNEESHHNGFATDLQAKLKSSCSGVGMTPYMCDVSMPYVDTASDELSDTSDESDVDVH